MYPHKGSESHHWVADVPTPQSENESGQPHQTAFRAPNDPRASPTYGPPRPPTRTPVFSPSVPGIFAHFSPSERRALPASPFSPRNDPLPNSAEVDADNVGSSEPLIRGIPISHMLLSLRAAAPSSDALRAVRGWLGLVEYVVAPPWPHIASFVDRLVTHYEQSSETLHNTLEFLQFLAISRLKNALATRAIPGVSSVAEGAEAPSEADVAIVAAAYRLPITEMDVLACLLISSKLLEPRFCRLSVSLLTRFHAPIAASLPAAAAAEGGAVSALSPTRWQPAPASTAATGGVGSGRSTGAGADPSPQRGAGWVRGRASHALRSALSSTVAAASSSSIATTSGTTVTDHTETTGNRKATATARDMIVASATPIDAHIHSHSAATTAARSAGTSADPTPAVPTAFLSPGRSSRQPPRGRGPEYLPSLRVAIACCTAVLAPASLAAMGTPRTPSAAGGKAGECLCGRRQPLVADLPWHMWLTAATTSPSSSAGAGADTSTPAGAGLSPAAGVVDCAAAFHAVAPAGAALVARLLGQPDNSIVLVPARSSDAIASGAHSHSGLQSDAVWVPVARARCRRSSSSVAVVAVSRGALGPRSLCALLAASAAAATAGSTHDDGHDTDPGAAAAGAARGYVGGAFARALVKTEMEHFSACHFDALFLRSAAWYWAEAAASIASTSASAAASAATAAMSAEDRAGLRAISEPVTVGTATAAVMRAIILGLPPSISLSVAPAALAAAAAARAAAAIAAEAAEATAATDCEQGPVWPIPQPWQPWAGTALLAALSRAPGQYDSDTGGGQAAEVLRSVLRADAVVVQALVGQGEDVEPNLPADDIDTSSYEVDASAKFDSPHECNNGGTNSGNFSSQSFDEGLEERYIVCGDVYNGDDAGSGGYHNDIDEYGQHSPAGATSTAYEHSPPRGAISPAALPSLPRAGLSPSTPPCYYQPQEQEQQLQYEHGGPWRRAAPSPKRWAPTSSSAQGFTIGTGSDGRGQESPAVRPHTGAPKKWAPSRFGASDQARDRDARDEPWNMHGNSMQEQRPASGRGLEGLPKGWEQGTPRPWRAPGT